MVVFICFCRLEKGERESGGNNTRCLDCFVLFCRASLRSLIFPSPPALCSYLLPRLRVVSSVQQLSVPLQHIRCSSCSLSDRLASHYSELLSAFILSCLFRTYAGIFLLVFVLFRLRSSYIFLFSTYVVLVVFLIFLHHILLNYCRLFVFLVLILLIILVWLVCYVLVPGTLAFHLPYLE